MVLFINKLLLSVASGTRCYIIKTSTKEYILKILRNYICTIWNQYISKYILHNVLFLLSIELNVLPLFFCTSMQLSILLIKQITWKLYEKIFQKQYEPVFDQIFLLCIALSNFFALMFCLIIKGCICPLKWY